MIINVHRIKTQNTGDLVSGPLRYLTSAEEIRTYDILASDGSSPRTKQLLKECSLIVVGGGGLLEHPKFAPALQFLSARFSNKMVIWGAGSNASKPLGTEPLPAKQRLVGVRDSNAEAPRIWVPCASCLSPMLHDKKKAAAGRKGRGIALIENDAGKVPARVDAYSRSDTRTLGNRKVPFEQIIEHILSAELVVTSSFHGAYWAILCGKPVIGLPTSSKFRTFRHPIPLTRAGQPWTDLIDQAKAAVYPNALDECVAANLRFMKQVNLAFPGVQLKWRDPPSRWSGVQGAARLLWHQLDG